MYATQSSRFGVPRHATVTPLRRRRRRPSTFASGFRLPSIVRLTSRYAMPVGSDRGRTVVGRAMIIARQPYERHDFSVKTSFVRAKCARACDGTLRAAWNRRIFGVVLSVDERIVIFRDPGCETASDRAISSAVDGGGHVDKLCAFLALLARRQRSARRRSRISRARIGPRVMNPVK